MYNICVLNRPADIINIIKKNKLNIDPKLELIYDMRYIISDISLKDCLEKFNLLYCQQNHSVKDQFKGINPKFDMYVCRYKIFKSDGKYCIEPYVTPKPVVVQNKENLPTQIDENKNSQLRSPSKRRKNSVEPTIIDKNSNLTKFGRSSSARSKSYLLSSDEEDNDVAASPRKKSKSENNENNNNFKTSVCRNLNDSMREVLNYSIEEQDNLRIKFKISEHQPKNTPTRRTRSKSILQQTVDTPSITPKSVRPALRKSILKTPSTHSTGKIFFCILGLT